jgi:hypothetical protein
MFRSHIESHGHIFIRLSLASNLLVVRLPISSCSRRRSELFSEGLTFKTQKRTMSRALADTSSSYASGFTLADLAALNDLRAVALDRQRWSRAQIVHAPFADYLAAWNMDAGDAAPPNLAIARFKRTGTYALTIDSLVVSVASSLSKILPTIRLILGSREQEVTAVM